MKQVNFTFYFCDSTHSVPNSVLTPLFLQASWPKTVVLITLDQILRDITLLSFQNTYSLIPLFTDGAMTKNNNYKEHPLWMYKQLEYP
jgi:hypothetical protein